MTTSDMVVGRPHDAEVKTAGRGAAEEAVDGDACFNDGLGRA